MGSPRREACSLSSTTNSSPGGAPTGPTSPASGWSAIAGRPQPIGSRNCSPATSFHIRPSMPEVRRARCCSTPSGSPPLSCRWCCSRADQVDPAEPGRAGRGRQSPHPAPARDLRPLDRRGRARPVWPPRFTAARRVSRWRSSTARGPGGQAGQSAKIENYLGFPAGLSGADLTRRAVAQATRFTAEMLIPVEATGLERLDPFRIVQIRRRNRRQLQSRSRSPPGSPTACSRRKERIVSRAPGVYYGASGVEAADYANQDVAVIGGGNSAGQAALYLSATASSVRVIVRTPDLWSIMSSYLVERILATPNIEIVPQTSVLAVSGDQRRRGSRSRGSRGDPDACRWRPCSSTSARLPGPIGWAMPSNATSRDSFSPAPNARPALAWTVGQASAAFGDQPSRVYSRPVMSGPDRPRGWRRRQGRVRWRCGWYTNIWPACEHLSKSLPAFPTSRAFRSNRSSPSAGRAKS